jgi:hypothetical protein
VPQPTDSFDLVDEPDREVEIMLQGDLVLHLKYPWQQVLLEAFMEFNSKQLQAKINAAQRVISARLRDVSPADLDEWIALQDALRSLRILSPVETAAQEPRQTSEKRGIV